MIMFKKICFLFLCGAVCICYGAAAANADTIFDNLGTSTTYTGSFSSMGSGTPMFPNQRYAGGFTASSGESVTEIDLLIASRFAATSGYSGAFTVEIWSSINGLPGGSQPVYTSPEQTAIAVYPNSFTGFNPMSDLQSFNVSGLDLTAGSYFLTVVGSQPLSDVVWWQSSTVGTTDFYNGTSWAEWSTQAGEPAFKILGESPSEPVPEPTTMLLFGIGIAGLAAVGRRKRS